TATLRLATQLLVADKGDAGLELFVFDNRGLRDLATFVEGFSIRQFDAAVRRLTPTPALLAEFACPLPRGFVADNNAGGGQPLLHNEKPEREAEIQPHRMTDNLGRKPISV